MDSRVAGYSFRMDSAVEVRRLCAQVEHRNISVPEFVASCARLIAETVDCSRAGIWVFEESSLGRSLRCLAMHDNVSQRLVRVPDETGDTVSAYFQALERGGHVMAYDARTHPATSGFFAEHLEVNGVRSLMAVSFAVNGTLFGAFTCTQVGSRREWTSAQLSQLRLIASKVSLALADAVRCAADTLPAPLCSG